MRLRRAAAALVVLAGLAAACGGNAKAVAPSRLIGRFELTAGHCTTADARPTGSYLVVVSAAQNHAVPNRRGGCADPAYTPLNPGTDGGLITGRFQPGPNPAFDGRRNSRARRIIAPTWFGPYRFGFATTSRDQQDAPSGAPTYPAPIALDTAGGLQVDLRSLVVTYAGKPHSSCRTSYGFGCWDLGSKSASGSYDAATHHFVLDWFAGESFTPKGDSIEVHLEGSFVPAARS